jgi:hypothetical protein
MITLAQIHWMCPCGLEVNHEQKSTLVCPQYEYIDGVWYKK